MSKITVSFDSGFIAQCQARSGDDDFVEMIKNAVRVFAVAVKTWGEGGSMVGKIGDQRAVIPPMPYEKILGDEVIPDVNKDFSGATGRVFVSLPEPLFAKIVDQINVLKADRTIATDDNAIPFTKVYIEAALNLYCDAVDRFRRKEIVVFENKDGVSTGPIFL